MAKVKSVITAYQAKPNKEIQGALDITGAFENIIQPIFPYPMMNLAIIVTFEEMERPGRFEVRLNAPDDDLITKGEFDLSYDPFRIGKKVMNLEKFLITQRGKYTVDIFEKVEDKVHFMKTVDLFIAEFPPQRKFAEGEVEKIIQDENRIKTVKTDFRMYGMDREIKLQVNLDKNAPIQEGYLTIPDNNILVIDGKEYDMTGVRRQIEWLFGNPIPKKN